MKKYELTAETKVVFGHTLHRIKAIVSFGSVEAGDLGGWIEKEENLNHSGNAWVYGDAQVYGNAQVYGIGAIFWVNGIGSRNGTTTFFACKDKKIRVSCGCFFGTLDEFRAKVAQTHGDNRHAKVYLLASMMAEERIDLSPIHAEEEKSAQREGNPD